MDEHSVGAEIYPVFCISAEQAEALQQCRWVNVDDTHIVLPFEDFTIRIEPAAAVVVRRALLDHYPDVRLTRYDVHSDRAHERRLLIAEKSTHGTTNITVDIEHACAGLTSVIERRAKLASGDTWLPLTEPSESATVARFVLSFLLMLNSRAARSVYGSAPTRQQKRRAQQSGEPLEQSISVYISRERIEGAVSQANRGIGTHARAAHSVRSHLRQLSSGVTVKVRSHTRGGKPTRIPIYDAKSLEITNPA